MIRLYVYWCAGVCAISPSEQDARESGVRSLFDLLATTSRSEKSVGIAGPPLDEVFAAHLRDHAALFALDLPAALGEERAARLVAEVLQVGPGFPIPAVQQALRSLAGGVA